jgi:uncharacterized protein
MKRIFRIIALFFRPKPGSPHLAGPIEIRSPREVIRTELPPGVERRVISHRVEMRASKDGKGPGMLVGYAAMFNESSVDLGGWIEDIAPGAFTAVLEDDCRCLRNHEDESLLGRTTAGTLRIMQDTLGLKYECDLPDTTVGRDTAESVGRKDMTGCSFQFSVAEGGATWDFNGAVARRTVTKYSRLYDVGPVAFPAFESTRVDVRSFEKARSLHLSETLEKARQTLSLHLAKARQRLAEATLPLPPPPA